MKYRTWNYIFTGVATFLLCNSIFCNLSLGQGDAFENFGSANRPTQDDGSSTRPDGSSTRSDGSSTRSDGSSTRSDGSSTRQDGSSTRDDNRLPSERQDDGPTLEREDLKPQQSIVVKEERAGWNEAGQGISRSRLSKELRAHWVMVDSNGLLRGTVIGFDNAPVPDATIYLISNGTVASTTSVNEQGQFAFNNIQEGTYGLVGIGETSFFAFGFNAIMNSNNPLAEAPRSITVMAGPNETSINTDWIAHFGPQVNYRVYGRFVSREGTDDPARLYGLEGIGTHYPESYPATTIQSHAVTALTDGRLVGRVHQIDSLTGRPVDVRNVRVMLLRNDDVYAATSTDNFGVFDFTTIPAGFYSLVAAGEDGMASIGLEVVANDPGVAFQDRESEGDDEDEEEDPALDVVPIDIALVPSEGTGWLVSHATEYAYQRAILRSSKLLAQRNQCNCPPTNPQDYAAILEALEPSDRGQFWKKLNKYFDDLVNGETPNQNQNRAPQQFQQQQFQQQQFQQQQFPQQQFQQQQFPQQQFQQFPQQQFQQPAVSGSGLRPAAPGSGLRPAPFQSRPVPSRGSGLRPTP